jgi:cytochrome P450
MATNHLPETTMTRFDPLDPAALVNPYPFYRRLQETDPVHWGRAGDAGLDGRWYVLRYADVMALLRDARFGREVDKVVPQLPRPEEDKLLTEVAQGWMILRDPPNHTRLRGLVMANYTPRKVQQLTPQIDAAARQLIAQMRTVGHGVDLLTHFALPLTVHMTALMLGLATDNTDKLTEWSRALAAVIDLNQAEEIRARVRVAVQECTDYVREVIATRRKEARDDLISALIHDPHDPPVSDDELIGTVTHLLFVGNDPVMHLFGNALITLATHPKEHTWLLANPDKVEGALDEIMRFDSPVQMTFRYALTDVEIQGRQMRVGDHIALVLGAANRDPLQYAEPDRLELTRPVGTPAHFGMGIHYCLGAPLARLEGQVGLRALMAEMPKLRPALTVDELTWQQTVAVRGVTELTVEW